MFKNPHRTRGIARIVFLIGGTCAEMARYIRSLSADVVVWVDVLSELEKVKAAPGVIRLVLANGQTLDTLFAALPDDAYLQRIRKHLKSRPGVDLNTGLAQTRFAGRRAAELMVATPEFRAVLQSIYEQVLVLHNGTIEKVEIELFSSGCGGTGGPAGGPILEEVARYYREHHRAVVHTRFNRAGSLSYTGLGQAISTNDAANVCADLAYTLLEPRPLAEVRSLNFFELPMLVKDKLARDRYMATLVQALNCSAFRELRDVTAPNAAAHNQLGSISLIDAGWWHDLGAERVRLNVAARFGAELLRLLDTEPARNVLERIEVESKPLAPVSEATLTQLVERLHQSKRTEPAGLLDAVENITQPFGAVTVFAHWSAASRSTFEDGWRERCQLPCRSVSEFRERLAFLRALARAVDTELVARSYKIASLQNNRRQTRNALDVLKDEYYPQSVTGRATNWLFESSRRRDRARRFGTLGKASRDTKLAIDKLEAESKALGRCAAELQKAIQENELRVRSVLRLLGNEASLAHAAGDADLVEIADLDNVLEELLQLADAPEVDDQSVSNTLLSCAKSTTLAGLKAITGAHEARVDAIAATLIKEPPTVGPHWGGKRPMSVESTVFVLPPVANSLRCQLLAAFAPLVHHSDRYLLVFGDTAEAGFNVVRMHIRHPKTYGEIVTPQIADEFDKLSANPELYFEKEFDIDATSQFVNGFAHHLSVGV